MRGICPKVGGWGCAEIGGVGRLLEFAEKPSIANGNTKKVISVILAPTDLGHSFLKDEKETDEVQTWATVASGKYKISNNK